tara:strand:+ start:6262 stop:7752 length:1491 start_codon:yes stop_codon:yes gene_type:complete
MFNDDITKSIASAVKDVLEGKPAVIKEEVKYPHDMFHPKTGEKEVANNEKEHNALDAKGYTHKKNEVAQPQKPSGKLGQDSGEKDFADKHKGKKVGEKEDGTVVKEETLSEAYNKSKELARIKKIDKLAEQIGKEIKNFPDEITDEETDDKDLSQAYYDMNKGLGDLEYGIGDYEYALKNLDESVNEMTISIGEKLNKKGNTTVDVDYIGDNDYSKKLEKAFKVKIKSTGNTTADITGPRKNIIDLLKSNAYLMDDDEIEETFPKELGEEVEPKEDEAKLKESEKQKAYQKFFNSALKKFGVSSPAELKDDAKKKEFFAYIDKNYKAKAEEIEAKGKDDEDVNEAMSQQDMEKRLKLIKKAVEKINRQNLRNAKADAMKMMKDSGMFDEDASDEEEVDELTDKQKKLPAGLQKAIKAKEKEEVKEGTITVKSYAGHEGGGDNPKKLGLKVKKVGSSYGYDDVEISGPDSKLVKFAQNNLGVSGRNLRAVQKELDDM